MSDTKTTPSEVPDPHIIPGKSRYGRRYSPAFKKQVLAETDACVKPGELGLYLRQQGLTHTTLTSFRKQRTQGALQQAVQPLKPKEPQSSELTKALLVSEREVRRLRRQLEQAQTLIEIQKKVSHLLAISVSEPDENGND